MVRRTFAFVFFLIIGIGLFISIILGTGLEAIGKSLAQFSLMNFVFLLVISLINFGLFVLRWDIILHHHHTKKRVPFHKLYLHRMAGHSVNYLTPSAQTAGEPVRIFFLQEEGVDTKDAVSSIVIDKVFDYTALILFIFSGVIVSIFEGSIFSGKLEILLGAMIVLFSIVIFWFYYATIRKIGFFSSLFRFIRLNRIKRIAKYETGIIKVENQMADFYMHNIWKFIFLLLLSFVTVSFMVLEHYLIAFFMGVDLTFLQSFLTATIPSISYIIPVPGGIGMLEGSHAGMFAVLGISINVFVFVLIIRLRDLVFILVGLGHASRHGLKMIFRSYKKNKNSNT